MLNASCASANEITTEKLKELGVGKGPTLTQGEWFLRPDVCRPEAARLRRETAVTGEFTPLELVDPAVARVVATISVRFVDTPAIIECSSKDGTVIVSGIAVDRLRSSEEPNRFLDRLLANGARPCQDTIGVGIVGYGPFGGMGYTHGLAATETPGLRFAAVCDSDPNRRVAAAADFPDAIGHPDLDSLEADSDVDVVIVATPPAVHASLALRLLRAGKHVVVEKPMCLTVADADLLLATADEMGRTISVHQSRRWDGDYLALRRAIDTGLLGEVFNMETFVGSFEHPCRWWHSDDVLSGGAVYDWGSHHIDWILQVMGAPPSEVRASSHKRVWKDVSNSDQIDVSMRWPDGREARFIQSDVAAIRKPKFYVQGTAGTAVADYSPIVNDALVAGRGHVPSPWHHGENALPVRLNRYEPGYGLVEMVLPPIARVGWPFHRALADHLLLGEPVPVQAAQSRNVVKVLEAAHWSAANKGELVTHG